MNNLTKKNAIIISIGYIVFSVLFSFLEMRWFSLVYFAAIAVVVLLADKIAPKDSFPWPNALTIAIAAMFCNNTMYVIFYNAHGNLSQLTAGFAIAIFFAGIFASTHKNNLPYSIVAAPILCFLNTRIALCYSALLACISVLNICEQNIGKKNLKKSKKREKSKFDFNILSIAVCTISFAVSVFLLISSKIEIENLSYYFEKFKNNPAIIIACVYLAVKLFKSGFKSKIPMLVCIAVLAVTAVAGYLIAGWAVFTLACLCILILLSLLCLKNEAVMTKIKENYSSQKFIFWALMLCMIW